MQEIEIVSFGMLNALGADLSSMSAQLETPELCPLQSDTEMLLNSEPCLLGRVSTELPVLPRAYLDLDSRFTRMLFYLYQQIENSVQELKSVFGPDRIGVVLGSSTSGVDKAEPAFRHRHQHQTLPSWYTFFHQEIGCGSAFLASIAGIRGPAYTISTACSSSAKVLKSAERLLNLGVCDAVVVGGVDALCQMTVRGFKSLNLLSPERCNPMSRNRNGLNIGEGGALFTLIKSPFGVQLRGVGESSDAYHISSPHPEGRGAIEAMRQALRQAQAAPEQVRYINMHGTATTLNDQMESLAIAAVCGTGVPCSSTKPFTGHLLGASGATELGLCILSLLQKGQEKPVPPHVWDGERDPALPELNLVAAGAQVPFEPEEDVLLSNSFAFGGNNCCVALGLGEQPE